MVKKAYRMDKKHTTCPYITQDTYQMLYHVIYQQPWHKVKYDLSYLSLGTY